MTRSLLSIAALTALLAACSGAPTAPAPSPPPTATTPAAKAPAAKAPADPAAEVPAAEAAYVCPMHPEVTSTEAGAKCPTCGMDLVKKNPPHGAPGHDHGGAH